MGEYLLGIDIGTSACKIAVFAKDGTVKATGTGDYQVYYPHPGWAEQNPEEWWEAVCDAIPRVLVKGNISPEEIKGIGIDGQSWSAIAVDKDGNVLTNTPIWMDTRATDICEEFNEKIGKDKIFELCGNSLQPSYTTAKIIWYQRNLPEVYAKTYKILQSNSYIAYKLTGVMTQDLSQGYGLHCFDMRTGTWNKEMCQEFGFSSELLPEIHACHEVIGEVNEKAAKESGLAEGTPVVAGGLDAACGTLGAGVIHSGETQEQGGQAGGMSICTDQYRADERLILGFHVVPDCWLLQGGTTGGGGVMRWLEREFGAYEREEGKRQGKSSLDLFNEEAAAVAPGSDGVIFLPYMSGERTPIWDRHLTVSFTGQCSCCHNCRNCTSESDQHRHNASTGKTDLTKQFIHYKCHTRDISTVFHHREEEEQSNNNRKKTKHASYSCKDSVDHKTSDCIIYIECDQSRLSHS